MSTLTTILVLLIGLFPYLFYFWYRLKEDFESPQIFSSAFLIFFTVVLCASITHLIIAPRFQPSAIFEPTGLWFWGGFLGFLVSLVITVRHYHLKFFETLEANVVGLLFSLFLIFLNSTLTSFSIPLLLGTLFLPGLISLFFLLDSQYKKFSWYRSGKVGFSGLVTLAIFFLIRATVAVRFGTMLSLAGRVEMVLSAVAAFLLFFAVYNLAELK